MKISDRVWKINVDSNVYVIDKKIVIDAGPKHFRSVLLEKLSEIVDPGEIEIVVFTHLHYDHIGNHDVFKNANLFASKAAIEDYNKNVYDTVLGKGFEGIKFNEFTGNDEMKVIETPGHTRGSICILFGKILFSGDMFFGDGCYGRTDLPTSVPSEMSASLEKIKKIDYEILCPGHDYVG